MDNIYDELFDYSDELKKVKNENVALKQQLSEEKLKNIDLLQKTQDVQQENTNLQTNISSLLKTAMNEISRKDSIVKELREELESVVMRRANKATQYKQKPPTISQPQATINESKNYPQKMHSTIDLRPRFDRDERKECYTKKYYQPERNREAHKDERMSRGDISNGKHKSAKSYGIFRNQPYKNGN